MPRTPSLIMLKRIWASRILRRLVYVALLLATVGGFLCWRLQIKSERDVVAFVGMARECHPVWIDLALGRVFEGQPVEEAVRQTNPIFVCRHGRYVQLSYEEPFSFSAISIIAKDGKLIRAEAGSCTWDHTFFGNMSDRDWKDYSTSIDTNERIIEYSDATTKRMLQSRHPPRKANST